MHEKVFINNIYYCAASSSGIVLSIFQMLFYGLPAELSKVLCTARVGVLEVYGHWLSLYTSGVLIDYLLPINSATNSHF